MLHSPTIRTFYNDLSQGPAALLRAAPDDVFAVIGSFLGVRLRDEDEDEGMPSPYWYS